MQQDFLSRRGVVCYRDPFSTDAGGKKLICKASQLIYAMHKRFLYVNKTTTRQRKEQNDKDIENRTECDAGQLWYAIPKRFPMCY